MGKRPHWRQLTLFDDLEVLIPVSVEAPQPSPPEVDPVGRVPAIDVTRIRRKRPERGPELDGLL